jgi:hypothetical protein
MRSRSTPPRPAAPGSSHPPTAVAERVGRRARATRTSPPLSAGSAVQRRARRGVAEPARAVPTVPELPSELLHVLAPEELYRREKARRAQQIDVDVMTEARQILAAQMAESGKKRGVTITPRGRPPKPKPRPDEFDLEEYGEAQVLGRGTAGAKDEDAE